MLHKIFGSFLGKKAPNYKSSTKSGNFYVNEQMVLQKNSEWTEVPGSTEAAAFTSVAEADTTAAQGIIIEGTHWFKFSVNHTAAQYYYKPLTWTYNSITKGAIRAYLSASGSAATENFLDDNIPMDYFVVGRLNGSTGEFGQSGEVEFSSQQLFNSTTGITGSARNYWIDGGSNYNGTKVMLGGGGRHGIYNTGQNPCSWGSANGAIGAGYDGSCGSYPSGLKLGLGDGDAYYNNVSGTFEFWIWNE